MEKNNNPVRSVSSDNTPTTHRTSGVLLHPTSLPGRYGIGDFGPSAIRFLDFLQSSAQSLWQVLPLNPPGYSNSPYQCYSAFAGNPLLISPEWMVEAGWISADDLANVSTVAIGPVDFERAGAIRSELFQIAFKRFQPDAQYHYFRRDHSVWLDDYALFMSLRQEHENTLWSSWPTELAGYQPTALRQARVRLKTEFEYHCFVQYLFLLNHGYIRREAASRGIRLIGDIPIFVAHDSVDVWAHQNLFQLDECGNPTVVAGVPPDYFSSTGQRWGNPLYRWDVMEKENFGWWMNRLRMSLALYDMVRIDHFRGFVAYWEIPADEATAVNGRWVPGPDAKFFQAVERTLGRIPILAEDLGVITPEVEALRDQFHLPGMKVLQFGFSDAENIHLPHNYQSPNCLVYTGTHDNDTTLGWWQSAGRNVHHYATAYLGKRTRDVVWDMIRLAFSSVARMAIIPTQDLLGLGQEGRMNHPGTESLNWAWRYNEGDLSQEIVERLKEMTATYGRVASGG